MSNDRNIVIATKQDQPITVTVLDYFEGWFDADVERITTKERMLELTAQGEGTKDGNDRTLDIQVEDVSGDIASVTVRSAVYHEYLQLVRTPDGWRIANTLWRSV
jgi:hypothetical protein